MKHRKRNFRLYVVGGIFAVLTLALWVRLVQVQVFARSYYAGLAEIQGKVRVDVDAVRGSIFDRNGKPMALSIRSCSVSARPEDVKDPSHVAARAH